MKYDGFKNLEDIKGQFESCCDGITEDEVLFASYGSHCYEGDAIVLIQRNGKLYTSEYGHCSCYGLEGGWELVETTKDILRARTFDDDYHKKFIEFLHGFLSEP